MQLHYGLPEGRSPALIVPTAGIGHIDGGELHGIGERIRLHTVLYEHELGRGEYARANGIGDIGGAHPVKKTVANGNIHVESGVELYHCG